MATRATTTSALAGTEEGRAYGGVGSIERRAERRARFLEAGLRAFGRDGYAATTTRSICAEAGLTQRYFYESFADLEALFLAVYGQIIADLKTRLARAAECVPEGDDGPLRATVTAYFQAVRDNRYAARVGLFEAFTASDNARLEARRTMEELAEVLGETLTKTFGKSTLKPALRRLHCIGLGGAIHHIALAWTHGGQKEPLAEVVEIALGLCRADAPSPARTRPRKPPRTTVRKRPTERA